MGIGYLTIDRKSTRDFGVFISGDNTFSSPERDVEVVEVPGRNGNVILDNGRFKNIEVKYPAFIRADFARDMAGFRNFIGSLTGYKRLEDSYHPDVYRMACFSAGLEPDVIPKNIAGEFDITFNCKPQRWLKSGEKTFSFTTSGSLRNPTYFPAKPFIRAYGTGTLTVGSYELEIDSLYPNGYIDIDCDLMNAYYGSLNYNNYVSGDFPVLEPGETDITWDGSSLEITPHWWML